MNVFFLASWYPDRKNPSLGIFIRRHAQAAALKNDVTVLHCRAEEDMKEGEFRLEKKAEGNFRELILHYGKSTKGGGLLRSWRNWKLLKKHYNFGFEKAVEWSGKPDLLHLNVPWPLGKITRNLARENKIPYVISEHWTGYYPEDGRYAGNLLKMITRSAVKNAALVLPVSQKLQKVMESHGLAGNYEVLGNVADTEVFKPSGQTIPVTRFIHVSSLDDKQKNVTGLLKAFSIAKKKEPSLELFIIGHGNNETAIRKVSNELSLTTRGVEFHGYKEGEDLANEFSHCCALVLNSRYENQPVVMLEAFAFGLPVIAPDIGGIAEILNEERGILFKEGSQEELVAALLKFHSDREKYHSAEIRNYAVKNFSFEAIGEKLNKIYKSVKP